MMATGGTQRTKIFEANTIGVWQFHVDWKKHGNRKVSGPEKIAVAPYHCLFDDCTIWYVGDYLKKDAADYSSRIGAIRLPGCRGK